MLQRLLTGVSRKAARHHRSKPFRMRNDTPLVSFTFDDVPDSAYLNGASILEHEGLRGTFYVAAGTCGTQDTHWRVIDRDQMRALHAAGHEIGCHTFSHVNVETLSAAEMDDQCRRNRELLRQVCGEVRVTNFCYPFGRLSLARKLQLGLEEIRGLMDGEIGREQHAGVAQCEHDERRRRHKVGEMAKVLRQQQGHAGQSHDDERERQAASRQRRFP
jgi:peptidoglycan/xylan/chitin deacetylase (PgdA/CDA1 family)